MDIFTNPLYYRVLDMEHAFALGGGIEELMRHANAMREPGFVAIHETLEHLCYIGALLHGETITDDNERVIAAKEACVHYTKSKNDTEERFKILEYQIAVLTRSLAEILKDENSVSSFVKCSKSKLSGILLYFFVVNFF
jgi:hypothetical protein